MTATPPHEEHATTAPPTTTKDAAEGGIAEGGIGLERLIFFSDAVFAIAITLLVLDIKIPEIPDGLEFSELPGRVAAVWPNILAYFISFVIIANFWVVHHGTFTYIRRYNHRLLWLNLYLLLFIAFLPFPAGVLARYGNTFFAFAFYAIIQITISLLLTALWLYATRGHRLVDDDLDIGIMRHRFYSGLLVPLIFASSIFVARHNVNVAFGVWFLSGFIRIFTGNIGMRRTRISRTVDRLVFRIRE